MKILTNRAFAQELYKAEERIRVEVNKERREEELLRNMWKIEEKINALTARVAVLENMLGKDTDAVVIDADKTC